MRLRRRRGAAVIRSLKAVRADSGRMKTVSSATRPSSSSSRKSMPSSSRSPTLALKRRTTVSLVGQLVDVGEVFEDGGDVGEDRPTRLAALEAAEEDRAVEDDVLAQRLGQQLEVLASAATAEWMRLGHRATLAPWDTRARAERPLLLARSRTRSARPGPALDRQAEHPALPAQRRPDRRQGRQGAGAAADHHRPQIRPAAHGAGRLPRRRRARGRDQHQRRQRQASRPGRST